MIFVIYLCNVCKFLFGVRIFYLQNPVFVTSRFFGAVPVISDCLFYAVFYTICSISAYSCFRIDNLRWLCVCWLEISGQCKLWYRSYKRSLYNMNCFTATLMVNLQSHLWSPTLSFIQRLCKIVKLIHSSIYRII